ncbi:MAG: nucleotidyltransferase family protein [Lachnospiraceae bacterium]|nr:nucleotidyltransferase family protein [Lachnospiraceae bacterium]
MNKHIFYMAAGNSRRFGENKLLYPWNGKPLFTYGLQCLQKVVQKRDDCTLTIVTQYEEIVHYAKEHSIKVVISPDSVKGMSYSMKAAIKSLIECEKDDFLMFQVADQPFLTCETICKLLDSVNKNTETASIVCNGQPGNPTIFSVSLIPELLNLTGDEGGRTVIRNHICKYVEIQDEKELFDVDTKEFFCLDVCKNSNQN